MGFRINTNINALNSRAQVQLSNSLLQLSVERLGSGLRINKAGDDASGMQIADSLRNQATSLNQAIRNANDGMGIVQIADKAMDEQIKILDQIKVKATQAAQDGQTSSTRQSIQADVNRLLEALDNIAGTTSFNSQNLLAGAYTNKEFQIGAFSNTTVKTSILSTYSDKIGHTRIETSGQIDASAGAQAYGTVQLTFLKVDGKNDLQIESVVISQSAGTGVGILAETINKNSERLNVKANFSVIGTADTAVQSGTLNSLTINGVNIGNITDIKASDSDGKLVAAINNVKDETGVVAYIDNLARLNVSSQDGRAIAISISNAAGETVLGEGSFNGTSGSNHSIVGRISLSRLDATDIQITGTGAENLGLLNTAGAFTQAIAEETVKLRDIKASFEVSILCAAGINANPTIAADNIQGGTGAGVTTLRGAMMVMDIVDSAINNLDTIRADLGSVQNQLTSTVNSISITEVNVRSAESSIRDLDFGLESANFSKNNILVQSGSFAITQSNNLQVNVLRLLA